MISLRNIIIFIGGAILYCTATAFLYYSVFSSHKFTQQQQKEEERKVTESKIKNLFQEHLPKHVSLVPIKPLGIISPQKMVSLQASQCDGTRGNTAPSRTKRKENPAWPNFSPSTFSLETDFVSWMKNNSDYWKRISRGLDGEALNSEKLKLNDLGLTLNGHLETKKDHLPIWLKAFKRTSPLDMSLAAICRIDDISDTILYVTIDGGDFDGILAELAKVTCVKIKVYFHPFLSDLKNLGMEKETITKALILNTHYIYGMYMLTQKLNYPYVITLEDDLEASPDFYRFHYSLYHKVFGKQATYYDSKKIFAITAYPHGVTVDCNFLADILNNEKTSKCGTYSMHQIIEEDYFPGWGSGVTKEIFMEYYSDWKYSSQIYDYGMAQLRSGRYSLVPCSPRVRTIANEGVNGANAGRWEHYLTYYGKWDEKSLDRVYYVHRRDGVIKADEKGKFMYNKLV